MNQNQYRTRKDQLAAFRRELYADCQKAGYALPPKATRLIAQALRDAAMVGASEERSRTLGILATNHRDPEQAICNRSVLSVLGFEIRTPRTTATARRRK